MTTYRLKKNLQDRMTDGSMIMLIVAALVILAMGSGQPEAAGASSESAGEDHPAIAAHAQVAGVQDSVPR